jgi:hypothetical protein
MDAIEIVRDLESAGFDRRQAEAIAGAVDKATTGPSARLATKDDISQLRTEIAAFRTELRAEIAAVRTELHRELGALAWKAAALLLGQAAFIIAVLKLTP